MGLLDKFKKTAEDLADDHGDKVKEGIDKAADFADDKTGGKHGEHIDKGAEAARDAVDKLAGDDQA